MKKVYIAGKVTGLPPAEVKEKFEQASFALRLFNLEPINPIDVVNNPAADWHQAMKLCIHALIDCDAVFILECAVDSKGAQLECAIAQGLDIPVFEDINDFTQWKNSPPTERKEKQ